MSPAIRSNLLLLLASAIWGFAFVAQRQGMEHVGPYTFTSVRFALAALVLLPFVLRTSSSGLLHSLSSVPHGYAVGLLLFGGAALQQIGIVTTTAGKAGFITGFYTVLVPILGYMFFREKLSWGKVIGALLAIVGLYYLSIADGLNNIVIGDFYVLAGAIFWAFHLLLISRSVARANPFALAMTQFIVCSVCSALCAVLFESLSFEALYAAAWSILYGGIVSGGLGYGLQILAQREADPTCAAIVLSLETVFAAIGGYIFLGELLSERAMIGCVLILMGMLVSQLLGRKIMFFKDFRSQYKTIL
jgi:drug/metabolite transporter (DMT)-like permease